MFPPDISRLASSGLSPHPVIHHVARSIISFFRTVPDLIWALFFVTAVDLGPAAGTLAIMIDMIGFCGRFFAEAMDLFSYDLACTIIICVFLLVLVVECSSSWRRARIL